VNPIKWPRGCGTLLVQELDASPRLEPYSDQASAVHSIKPSLEEVRVVLGTGSFERASFAIKLRPLP